MKWIARVGIEVEFEAKDANEAGEVANALHVPTSFAGHPIIARSHAYLASIEQAAPKQDGEASKAAKGTGAS